MRLNGFKLALVALVASVLTTTAGAQSTDTFTCRASALRIVSPLVDSEALVANPANNPCASQSDELAEVTVFSLATANVLTADTSAQSSGATSKASVANATVTLGGLTIAATVLESNAAARCTPGSHGQPAGPAFAGSSKVTTLDVDGNTVTVTGKPNQTITLLGGTLKIVINEQIQQSDRITVRALRVTSVLLSTNVVVAESIAGVSGNPCGGTTH